MAIPLGHLNRPGHGTGTGERGGVADAVAHGGLAQVITVRAGILSHRRVNHQVDFAIGDLGRDVGGIRAGICQRTSARSGGAHTRIRAHTHITATALGRAPVHITASTNAHITTAIQNHVLVRIVPFPHLAHLAHRDTGGRQGLGGADGRRQLEAQMAKVAGQRDNLTLVLVADADEHRATGGQRIVDGKRGLGVGNRVVAADAHHLAGRLHLRPEDGVGAREAAKGHDGLLDAEVAQLAVVRRQAQLGDARPGHNPRRAFRQRHTAGLGRERHGAAGAGVDLQHVDIGVLDGELDVQQAAHTDGQRQAGGIVTQRGYGLPRKRERRDAAGRVTAVDAGLLEMLQQAADIDLAAVTERVDINLDGAL